MTWQQYPNIWLCSLDDVKDRRASSGGTDSDYDNAQLSMFIEQASSDIVRNLQSLPLPHVATALFDYSSEYIDIDSRVLNVYRDTDILEITSISNGDSSSVASSAYTLKPNNAYPKYQIALKETSGVSWRGASGGDYEQVISITGIFGNVPHYPTAWHDVGLELDGDINATITTVTVNDGTLLSIGHYIKINDEVMFVEAISSNDLTVQRGALGTTAASHTDEDTITRFQFKNDLRLACAEWASYLYSTKDKLGDEVITFNGGVQAPRGLAPTVIKTIMGNRKVHLDGLTS